MMHFVSMIEAAQAQHPGPDAMAYPRADFHQCPLLAGNARSPIGD